MARKNKKVKSDQLGPLIAEGYTNRPMTPEDARREFPVNKPPKQGISHMRHAGFEPVCVVESNGIPMEEPNTGRKMQDASVTRPAEHIGQIKAGYRCLWCGEPFEEAWPKNCPVCGYEVSERQGVEAQVEIAGETHLGPARGIALYLEDLEEQSIRREFDQKILAGKSPMKGLH